VRFLEDRILIDTFNQMAGINYVRKFLVNEVSFGALELDRDARAIILSDAGKTTRCRGTHEIEKGGVGAVRKRHDNLALAMPYMQQHIERL